MNEHILACLSSAPSNARIIRTAAQMARAFRGRFTALYVETPDYPASTPEDKTRLLENRKLAEQLGAKVETVVGDDVPYQIAEFARISGVTKIVLGRSSAGRRHPFGKPPLTEQLLFYAPEIEIHIIPDKKADVRYRPRKTRDVSGGQVLKDVSMSALILVGATLLSLLFHSLGFTDANIILVYILGVVLTAIATSHQIYSLVSAVASVFIFNYLFTVPRFSLAAYGTGYPVTFVVMFLTAYITATLAGRYKLQAAQSAKIAQRTQILFDTDQLLAKAGSKDEILNATAEQIQKLLDRNIVIFGAEDGKLSAPRLYWDSGRTALTYDRQREHKAAEWVLQNNHAAGATTDVMSDVNCLYFALRVLDRVYGVIGIEAGSDPLDSSEQGILLSILGECALALENEKNTREKEAAAVLAESEQLRANLLRTISHDLRTPLTSISGNASNLLTNGSCFDEETKQQIYRDIYKDSLWLINLVENLLYATRIEEGRMTLTRTPELVSEILEDAVRHMSRSMEGHPVTASYGEEMLLVKADAKLIVQVIANIMDNAVKYTPPGTPVTLMAERAGDMAEIRIADTGSGIPDEEKEKIFEKFYSGNHRIADNRRSIGLGLYLCKAIVEAHGGTIHVEDNRPSGAVFVFTLPLEETSDYE